MKILSALLLLVLAGCGSMDMEAMSMLDTAPRDESQLLHPDWAEPDEPVANMSTPSVEGPYGQRRSEELQGLLAFLSSQGIEHEVVPGGHLMIKLKQKINFNTGSSKVSKGSKQWLDALSVYLANQPNVDIVIDGHTDSTGTNKLNDSLSENRALQVKQQLMNGKVSSGAIYTRGYGKHAPACNNSTVPGKACNRRVELTFILANN
ncbi:OmpA family protein [Vibrio sp. MACH09]|uniref:OmpA family protein n=1 Tax=unclassified Vibrio TaxID=2614977 RepID=UPI00295E2C7A|nr:OmpA family protein [Vibrio sp. MACH09]